MSKTKNVLVLNGPNLNMLGMREPDIYGFQTLDEIEVKCRKIAEGRGVAQEWFQSNSESPLIDKIQQNIDKVDWVVINAAGLTHTSVVLRDALAMFPGNIIEVHLSNIHARESFRHKSLISPIAIGIIAGFGAFSYQMALEFITNFSSET